MANNRFNFYYNYYQTFLYGLIVSLFLLLAMVVLVLYQLFHRPLPIFEAIAKNNKRMVLTPYFEPNYLPSTILKWASKAAVASYNFNFIEYEQQIALAAPFYTGAGWAAYRSSVNRLISDIIAKRIFVNSVVSGAPVITHQGMYPGKGYTWRIQMPFLVSYTTAETVSRESYFVLMTVVKIPTTVEPTGIGIDQFQMR